MEIEWDLSRSFTSDGQGIRCATCLGDSVILTGTQGGSLIAYDLNTSEIQHLHQHDHAVVTLLSNERYYVTGCKDSIIRVFNHQHELLKELKSHEKPVTSLAWASSSLHHLISGSWDGTARIWNLDTASEMAVLPNHENSVCVTGLPNDDETTILVATGSAGMAQNNVISGMTVRLWSIDTKTCQVNLLHSVANDHEGPIRSISYASNALWTCSNDGTIKIRDASTGKCQSTLLFFAQQQQHPPMLLSIAAIADSAMASAAEDGNVVVWENEDSSHHQIIRHAACVWNVIGLWNGDIATCCDDGILRIFTKSTDRMAPTEERERFASEVQSALQKTQNGPSPEEIAKLPRWEDNVTVRGNSEGQVQVFQKNGVAIAAQWNAASQAWIEVGEVTGRSDAGMIDGVTYDHVFPIEIDQTGGSVATLQIGYNTGENPFVAAQRFIDAHMLPQYHLSQIAEYLQQRSGQQPTMLGQESSKPVPTTVSYQYLPIRSYKTFDLPEKTAATTLDKMKIKLQEFAELSDDSTELSQVSSLTATLSASNRYHSSKIQDSELKVLASLLNNATPSKAFPALDLARLTVLHPDAADRPSAFWVGILQRAISLCTTTESLEGPAVTAIPMLSLRLFANSVKAGGAQQAVATYLELILDCAQHHAKSGNKNVRLSVATLLYNVSFYCHQKKDSVATNTPVKIVGIINEILDSKSYEAEATLRVVLALGTVCMTFSEAKDAANGLYLTPKVQMASSPHTEQAKAAAKDVASVLSG